MTGLLQDLHYALRLMRKRPLVSLLTILTLGVGIGANTAIFGAADAMVLRPLPFTKQEELVRVRETRGDPADQTQLFSLSPRTYVQWRDANEVFTDIAAATGTDVNVTGGGTPERYSGALVTTNFFRTLGIAPVIGRDFRAEEDRAAAVVLLGYGVWQTRFGGSPGVLGQTINVNGRQRTVIGVMPRNLRHPYEAEMWLPLHVAGDEPQRSYYLYAPARLKPGVTPEMAERSLAALAGGIDSERPAPDNPRAARVSDLRTELAGDVRATLLMLFAGAGFLLLLGTANVASLLLVESMNRQGELAVRSALGASRARLARQMFAQNLVLAAAAAGVALFLAFVVVKPLVAFSPANAMNEFDSEMHADMRSLAFTFVAALLVGTIATLLPVIKSTGIRANDYLRAAARSVIGGRQRRTLDSIVVVEIATAVVLVSGALVVLQSFRSAQRQTLGFEARNRWTFDVGFAGPRYEADPVERERFINSVVDELRRSPLVAAAGATTTQPMFQGQNYAPYNIEALRPPERGVFLVHHRVVTPGYLGTLGIRILRGRDVSDADTRTSPAVAVISKSMADHLWPGRDPIGQRVKVGALEGPFPWLTVVGVAADVTHSRDEFADTNETWYLPLAQNPGRAPISFVVNFRGSAEEAARTFRAVVDRVDRDQPIFNVAGMEQLVYDSYAQPRFLSRLFGGFALTGLLLACVGLYGVLSYTVARRRREIGVRMAMGARPGDVVGGILRETALLTFVGLALGVLAAWGLTHAWSAARFGIEAVDPLTTLAVAGLLCLVAVVSVASPARRAATVDPLAALRSD